MKKTRKILAVAACAVLLVCISVGATVAYLTSNDTVTNTFTVGKVAITLDEAKVNGNGTDGKFVQTVNNEEKVVDKIKDADRVKANTYNLIPGHTYDKDPTVHVAAGSESCYVFIKVDNGLKNYEAAGTTIGSQILANGWTQLEDTNGDPVNVYYQEVVKSATQTDLLIFRNFKIADNADEVKGWAGVASNNIAINAYAVQADGMSEYYVAYKMAGLNGGNGWLKVFAE